MTEFIQACKNKDYNTVKLLINNVTQDILNKGLYVTAIHGHLDLYKLLVQHGAKTYGDDRIYIALDNKYITTVKYLLDLPEYKEFCDVIFLKACRMYKYGLMRYLLKNKNIDSAFIDEGMRHIFQWCSKQELIQLLIKYGNNTRYILNSDDNKYMSRKKRAFINDCIADKENLIYVSNYINELHLPTYDINITEIIIDYIL